MKQFRVGIIGLGGMSNVHIDHMNKIENVKITAVCDIKPDVLEKAGNRLNIPANKRYIDYRDLIADRNVDAVVNVTPNDVHYDIVKSCLLHDKPVMTEKPFTRIFKEAYELNQLSSYKQVPAMVGFSYRYVPSFRYARDIIQQGKLGPIRHVFVQYLQSWGLPMYETPMNWRYSNEISGTGVLADLGTHMVDAARFLIGEFKEVAAILKNLVPEHLDPTTNTSIPVDIDDFTGFVATLDNQVAGVFQTSRNAYGSGNQLEVAIYGEKGTINVCCEDPEYLTWTRPNAELGNPSCLVKERHRVPDEYKLGQMQDFFDMLSGNKREELPDIRDGYANQEVLEAIFQAARSRKTIAVADIRKLLNIQGAN